MKNSIVFKILLIALVWFGLVRLGLFAVYWDYFADANLVQALWQGARFDAKLSVLALSPFLLILLFPFGKFNNARVRRVCAWACFIVLCALFALAMGDMAYFGEVQRHIGGELLNISNDLGFIVQTALGSRWLYTAIGMAILAIMAWLWHKTIVQAASTVSGSLPSRATNSIITLIILVFAARGFVLTGKSLNTVDAFNGNGQVQANLTLNGALVTLQAVHKRQQQQPLIYLDSKTDQQYAAQNPQPFLYHSKQPASRKNIVFILLESWSYRYIDGLAGNGYGVTPYMDSLISRSQVWDNFYAAGQRSIIGIQATLTSVPALPDRQPLGFGLELSNMSRIAELAGKHGYRTLMAQSSKRRSFHMDGIAQTLGFQEYYGQEDVPLLRHYPQETPPFGWDYDTLQFLGQQINKQPERPFFAFLFTGTTHEPFANAGTEFAKYPHDIKGETGFLNSLAYSDWAVREFMNNAAQQSWYNNTIFVFTADHILSNTAKPTDVRARFHIPLIIFDPNQPQPVRHQRLASQYDLLPTFVDILGIDEPIATFGSSLFSKQPALPLMLNQGSSTAVIAPDGTTAEFQGTQLTSGSLQSPAIQQIQWRMQTADQLLRNNRWLP